MSASKAIQTAFRIAIGVAVFVLIGVAVYQEFVPGQLPTDSRMFNDDDFQRDSLPPPGHTVKGNISITTGAKLYHIPGMQDYEATVIDISRGERWFRTENEAIENGWIKAGPKTD